MKARTDVPEISWAMVFPLVAAVVYVAGAMLLKRATQLGADAWRMAWVCNLVMSVAFSPLLLLGGTFLPITQWWQPGAVGMLFVVGQVLTFRSLQVGDVSVATPVLGVKIILVALLTTVLLRDRLTPALWGAAALSSAAIALLNFTRSGHHHHVGLTIMLAGGAAAAYALFDVLVQKWSPAWGVGRFLPAMMGFVALFSVGIRLFAVRTKKTPGTALPWVLAGAACLAVQGVLFVSAIAVFGQATVANVLYSSRGLWSVVAVWMVGHWFMNQEKHLGGRVMMARLIGAAMMMGAVVLVLMDRKPVAEVPARTTQVKP